MCTITGTCNLKEFTGYKVALKINGKYYSPVTGMEYTLGKIKPPKTIYKNYTVEGFADVLENTDPAHERRMIGNIAVFVYEKDAEHFRKHLMFWHLTTKPVIILKMTLQNVIFKGEYLYRKVRIGSTIKSIKECH